MNASVPYVSMGRFNNSDSHTLGTASLPEVVVHGLRINGIQHAIPCHVHRTANNGGRETT